MYIELRGIARVVIRVEKADKVFDKILFIHPRFHRPFSTQYNKRTNPFYPAVKTFFT